MKELLVYKRYNCLVFRYMNHIVAHKVDGKFVDLLSTKDYLNGIIECCVVLNDRLTTVKVDIKSLFVEDGLPEGELEQIELIQCINKEKHTILDKLYTENLDVLRELKDMTVFF